MQVSSVLSPQIWRRVHLSSLSCEGQSLVLPLTSSFNLSSHRIRNTGFGGCVLVGQSLCQVQLFVTRWTAACQASSSLTISRTLPKFLSIELVVPSNHLILGRPLLLPPSIFPSLRVFSSESALCIRWPKYRSFSFSISPSNVCSGLISFRMDWCDLLAVLGTLKSLLQHIAVRCFKQFCAQT